MNQPTFIAAFIVLTLLMSFTYFYLFARSQERYIQYWGLSWLVYSMSLFLLILSINLDSVLLLELRKILDMLNILFLLFGSFAFMHIHIPTFWARFVLYLTIWVLIGTYYQFDLLSVYLPISMYQIIASLNICYIIMRYWNTSPFEKALSVTIFLLWGLGKAVLSTYEVQFYEISSLYLFEIIFSNILNFCIFIIYLNRTKASVALAERLYKMIAENATDIIFYYELVPQPAFRYITPSVEKITGYSPGEFYGNPRFYQELAIPGEMEAFSAIFNGTSREIDQKVFQIQSKDSSLIWVEVNDSVLYENGEMIAIEGIIRDISKTKEDEEALLNSKQSRDLLFSYISHEIKTPVTAILGYINALKDGTLKSDSEQDAALEIIFNKSMLLQRLIQDLVQLSKLETRQFSFHLTHVSALELCENLVEQHAMDVQRAGFTYETFLDRTLLEKAFLIVDTERIDQVFTNIIFNALKYCHNDGIIRVSCTLDRDLKNLVVQIADNGEGIPPEDLPHIFERFYRGRNSLPRSEGTSSGLGLTLSMEIIQSFKGTLSAQNAKTGGSIFTFTLPLYKESL